MAAKKETPAKAKQATTKKTAASGKIRVQYYRSATGFSTQQKLTVKGLGFGKLNSTRELIDTPSLRGMIEKVPHLVRIIE